MSIGIGLLIGIVCELERDEMKLATKERRDEMKWRKQRPYFGHHGSHFTRKKRRVSCREIPRVFSSVTSHAMTWWWQDCPWTFAIPHATRVALSSTTTFRAAATLRLAARNPRNSDHTLATTAPESVFTGEFARFRTVTLPNYLRMDGWRDDVVVTMRIWDMNMMTTLPLDVRLYFGSFPTKLPLNKTQHKTQSTKHNTNHTAQHKSQHKNTT